MLGMSARRHPLEAVAVVLLGLGGLIYPPVWLAGALLAILSKLWNIRDKWTGLAIPVLLVVIGMVADIWIGGSGRHLGAIARGAWLFGGHLSRVLAVSSAVFLAWRMEHRPRQPRVPPWNRPHRFG
jgi:hypothetical protein